MPGTEKPLAEKHRRHLRGLAHGLKPVCRLGSAGVTEAFMAELESALTHHELIKLKAAAANRTERDAAIATIVSRTGARLISRIGNVAVLYRASPDGARLKFPDDKG